MPPRKKAKPNPQKKRKYKQEESEDADDVVAIVTSDSEEEAPNAKPIESKEEEIIDNDNYSDNSSQVDEDDFEEDDDDEDSLGAKRKKSKNTSKAKKKGIKGPKKVKKPKYQKKEKTLGGVMSKLKFRNIREACFNEPSYQATAEYYATNPTEPVDIQFLSDRYEAQLKDLPILSLETWLQEREISQDCFQTIIIQDKSNPNHQIELPPFTGTFMDKDAIQLDQFEFYCNLSGPIWQLAVAPYPSLLRFADAQTVLTFHIAIGMNRVGWPLRINDYELRGLPEGKFVNSLLTNPYENTANLSDTNETEKTYGVGNDFWRATEEIEQHDNLLPIFSMTHKIFKVRIGSSTMHHSVSYFVGLEARGSILRLAWNPLVKPNNLIIGLLAIVCGDGVCVILLLPNESLTPKQAKSSYLTLPVISEADITVCAIIGPTSSIVMSVSWHPSNINQICCGMSDGSVAIYDLSHAFTQDHCLPQILLRFRELCAIPNHPAMHGVTACQICPYDPSLIISGGYDGKVKVWQKGKMNPILIVKPSSAVSDVLWDPMGCGFYFTDSDSTAVNWEPTWSFLSHPRMRSLIYHHNRRMGTVWKLVTFLYQNLTLLCSVSSEGSIRGGFAACLGVNKEPLLSLFEYFRVISVINPVSSPSSAVGSATAAPDNSSSHQMDSEQEKRTPLITIDTNFSFGKFPLVTNEIQRDHSVSLHTIDHLLIEDKTYSEKFHLLAFGGAAGFMAIKLFSFPSIPDDEDFTLD